MNIKKILYASDISPNNEAALGYTASLAAAAGAALFIVHVDDTTPGLVLGAIASTS
jgi:nucleotide-binding universal stress UspA family protein